jgi:membrane-associated HD superfamily phosphohydrolase
VLSAYQGQMKMIGTAFKEKSLEWLKERYRDNLRCVIAHEKDESHPHIHFYAVPKVGQSFDDIHEGKKAQKEIKKQNPKATKQQQNIAFAEAMRARQDDFSRKVGQRFGLTRIGPGKRRLTRAAWNAEQKQAEALKQVEQTARKRREHYKNEGLKAGKSQALQEAQRPLEKIGNLAKVIKNGLFIGWNQLTSRARAQTSY